VATSSGSLSPCNPAIWPLPSSNDSTAARAHPRDQQPVEGGGHAAALHVAYHDLADVKSLVGVVIGEILLNGAQAGLPAFGHDDDVADVMGLDDAGSDVA